MSSSALLAVFDKYPCTLAGKYSYGTSGFRGIGSTLIPVACRMGPLMVLRCVVQRKELNTTHGVSGICITASHNPAQDNGLKQIDITGDMLSESWEPFTESLANAASGADAVKVFEELLKQHNVTWEGLRGATVHLGRDTRPTGDAINTACIESIQAVGGVVRDFGIVTTPHLHYTVERAFHNLPIETYFNDVVQAFNALYPATSTTKQVLNVDCSNGVGTRTLKTLFQSTPGLQNSFDLKMFNDNTDDAALLNENCGADFVQKKLVWPSGMTSACVQGGAHAVSLDGDADRVVYMLPGSKEGDIRVVDGDRLLSLYARYLQVLLREANLIETTNIVIVQTAYANGGSTIFIRDGLQMKVSLVPTGVKHCHKEARKGDIGIFFEANGHGTAVFSPSFLAKLSSTAATVPAAQKILDVGKLLSQVCGDAITDMLMAEVALASMNLTVDGWMAMYTDLPSRQLKVEVPNPRRIQTTWEQTRVTYPADLQTDIDAAVAKYPAPARCFVRASGTEEIVRVYAECEKREDCDALAAEVSALVKKHIT